MANVKLVKPELLINGVPIDALDISVVAEHDYDYSCVMSTGPMLGFFRKTVEIKAFYEPVLDNITDGVQRTITVADKDFNVVFKDVCVEFSGDHAVARLRGTVVSEVSQKSHYPQPAAVQQSSGKTIKQETDKISELVSETFRRAISLRGIKK